MRNIYEFTFAHDARLLIKHKTLEDQEITKEIQIVALRIEVDETGYLKKYCDSHGNRYTEQELKDNFIAELPKIEIEFPLKVKIDTHAQDPVF